MINEPLKADPKIYIKLRRIEAHMKNAPGIFVYHNDNVESQWIAACLSVKALKGCGEGFKTV